MTNRSLTARLRPALPEVALHGLAGDVARVLSAETGADPAGILLVFLTMFGNAAGPQPHLVFGFVRQSARLFVVIVGDAATGGKGTILAVVEQLFAAADPDWYSHRILTGLQSPEAMIDQVADGSGDCRLLIVEPEFARLASRMASSGTAFSAQLRNAYDGRPLEITRSSSRSSGQAVVRASNAHIGLIGEITPQELLSLHGRLKAAGPRIPSSAQVSSRSSYGLRSWPKPTVGPWGHGPTPHVGEGRKETHASCRCDRPMSGSYFGFGAVP